MNLQLEISKIQSTISVLEAKRFDAEKEHGRWANSIRLADLGPSERVKAPEMRGRLIQRVAEIDRELAKAGAERSRLNDAHLAAAKTREQSTKPTADLRLATKTLETLEQRQTAISEQIADTSQRRSKIILGATTGDAKAKAEAERMSVELIGLARDAEDLQAALLQARSNLQSAQAEAAAKDSAKRTDEGRKIGSEAAAEAEEFDRLMIRAVEILDRRHARTNELLKLGVINSTTANRIRSQRVILGALIRAGMKRHIGDLNAISGATWLAESDRVLFPTIERAAAKAA